MLEVSEILKSPFWIFWGVMFYASLEMGKAGATEAEFRISHIKLYTLSNGNSIGVSPLRILSI